MRIEIDLESQRAPSPEPTSVRAARARVAAVHDWEVAAATAFQSSIVRKETEIASLKDRAEALAGELRAATHLEFTLVDRIRRAPRLVHWGADHHAARGGGGGPHAEMLSSRMAPLKRVSLLPAAYDLVYVPLDCAVVAMCCACAAVSLFAWVLGRRARAPSAAIMALSARTPPAVPPLVVSPPASPTPPDGDGEPRSPRPPPSPFSTRKLAPPLPPPSWSRASVSPPMLSEERSPIARALEPRSPVRSALSTLPDDAPPAVRAAAKLLGAWRLLREEGSTVPRPPLAVTVAPCDGGTGGGDDGGDATAGDWWAGTEAVLTVVDETNEAPPACDLLELCPRPLVDAYAKRAYDVTGHPPWLVLRDLLATGTRLRHWFQAELSADDLARAAAAAGDAPPPVLLPRVTDASVLVVSLMRDDGATCCGQAAVPLAPVVESLRLANFSGGAATYVVNVEPPQVYLRHRGPGADADANSAAESVFRPAGRTLAVTLSLPTQPKHLLVPAERLDVRVPLKRAPYKPFVVALDEDAVRAYAYADLEPHLCAGSCTFNHLRSEEAVPYADIESVLPFDLPHSGDVIELHTTSDALFYFAFPDDSSARQLWVRALLHAAGLENELSHLWDIWNDNVAAAASAATSAATSGGLVKRDLLAALGAAEGDDGDEGGYGSGGGDDDLDGLLLSPGAPATPAGPSRLALAAAAAGHSRSPPPPLPPPPTEESLLDEELTSLLTAMDDPTMSPGRRKHVVERLKEVEARLLEFTPTGPD